MLERAVHSSDNRRRSSPAEQIDRYDGDLIVHVDVASAVSKAFDFSGIWRCKRVTVSIDGREFAATVSTCSLRHRSDPADRL